MLTGCVATSGPRFSQPISTALAQEPMRKFETDTLELYYPARHQAEAMRVASRLSACITHLRSHTVSQRPRAKFLVYLTTADFDNAYVQPEVAGYPQQMVLPSHMLLEFFNWLEFGESEIGDISCHESTHYVQMQQVEGLWRIVNAILGSFVQPNIFTESWFLEGLATHYEGRLGKEVGRPESPVWNGMFQSIVEMRGGELGPGDLNPEARQLLPFGGNYLVGQQFVDYLARTYGAKKLWELVDVQGSSILSPFGVTLRFKAVYGKSIGALFSDFSEELAAHLTHRERPATQQVLTGDLGYFARVAVSPSDSALALATVGLDEVPLLTIRESDGRVRAKVHLTQILPPRAYVAASPEMISGLTFSPDGGRLYFVLADVSPVGDDQGRLLELDAHTGKLLRVFERIHGMGGSVSPDGGRYVFVEVKGDTANLVELALDTGERLTLTQYTHKMSLGAPAYSPDGTRVAFSAWVGDGFDLFVREPDGQLRQVTDDGHFNYGAHWVDDNTLVFARETEGRAQVFLGNLYTGALTQVTNAPFLTLDAFPFGKDRVAFLNRDGWGWTLDSAPLPPTAQGVVPSATPSPTTQEELTEPPLPVGVDSPYHPLDHLLIPVLRSPFVEVFGSWKNPSVLYGAAVSGSDRLGLHNYGVNVWHQTGQKGVSFALGYNNYQLAPWLLSTSLSRVASGWTGDRELDWQANVSATRTFWDWPVGFGFTFLHREDEYPGNVYTHVRMAGPSASIDYAAVESTPYGGGKLGLGMGTSATYYPAQLTSQSALYGPPFTLLDLRGYVDGFLPLPGPKRQQLYWSLVAHGLPGAPTGLLDVGGGIASFSRLWTTNTSTSAGPNPNLHLPAGVGFSEAFQGYEDFTIHATRVAIGHVDWSYPLIFDKGTASTLYLFPSFFLRQVNFDLFANLALTDTSPQWHRDVGSRISVELLFGQALPVSLFVQWAYRFDDNLGLQIIGLTLY
jgi:hypothetical protein